MRVELFLYFDVGISIQEIVVYREMMAARLAVGNETKRKKLPHALSAKKQRGQVSSVSNHLVHFFRQLTKASCIHSGSGRLSLSTSSIQCQRRRSALKRSALRRALQLHQTTSVQRRRATREARSRLICRHHMLLHHTGLSLVIRIGQRGLGTARTPPSATGTLNEVVP
jgi:hypothetical protein